MKQKGPDASCLMPYALWLIWASDKNVGLGGDGVDTHHTVMTISTPAVANQNMSV